MRDPKRIRKFCNRLAEIWECCPDLRFGQLITIVFSKAEKDNTDPFYIEDEEMLKRFQNTFQNQMEEIK